MRSVICLGSVARSLVVGLVGCDSLGRAFMGFLLLDVVPSQGSAIGAREAGLPQRRVGGGERGLGRGVWVRGREWVWSG